jgi:bla regulator protein blaR1
MAILAVALSNVIVAALLAVPAWLAGLWGRRPALTHALWLLVLIKLVTPPLFECPIAVPAIGEPAALQPEVAVVNQAPPPEEPAEPQQAPPASPETIVGAMEIERVEPEIMQPMAPAGNSVEIDPNPSEPTAEVAPWEAVEFLLLVWLAGSLGWLALATARLWRFHRMIRFAQPASAHVQEIASSLAWALQVRCPEIGLVAGNISPMLWSLGRSPRLLLPADLLARLTPDQLATLLAHELAHWRRRDDRVRLLEFVVLATYWWCPLAWWARRQLHQSEEECCDAWVVSLLPQSAKAYALALVETVDFLSSAPAALPLAASGLGRVRFLKRRLTMILQGKTPRTLTFTGLLGVAALGFLMLPLVFSQTQEMQVGAQVEAKKADPTRTEQLDKAREDIQKAQDELKRDMDKFHADVKMRQREMEKRADFLQKAMQRLHDLEAATGGGQNGGGNSYLGQVAPGHQAEGNIDQRLKRVEAKLDAVLDELRKMRHGQQSNAKSKPNPTPRDSNFDAPPQNNLPRITPRDVPTPPLDSAVPR